MSDIHQKVEVIDDLDQKLNEMEERVSHIHNLESKINKLANCIVQQANDDDPNNDFGGNGVSVEKLDGMQNRVNNIEGKVAGLEDKIDGIESKQDLIVQLLSEK